MQGQYNMRSPAVKRLMKEAQELRNPTEQYYAQPLEENLFEWHFTIRGPSDSEFETGIYHGRIVLPPDYPMKPPSIIIMTPNGRFETNKKICLSISGHHPESWQPSWSIRTALLAIIGFMPTHGAGAIGSLDYTPEERKVLAKRSQNWECPDCGIVTDVLLPVTEASKLAREEAKQLATQINFQGEKEKGGQISGQTNESRPQTEVSSSGSQPMAPNQTSAATSIPNIFQFPAQNVQPPNLQFPFPFPFPPFPQPMQQWDQRTNSQAGVPRFPMPFATPLLPPFSPIMGFAGGPLVPIPFPYWHQPVLQVQQVQQQQQQQQQQQPNVQQGQSSSNMSSVSSNVNSAEIQSTTSTTAETAESATPEVISTAQEVQQTEIGSSNSVRQRRLLEGSSPNQPIIVRQVSQTAELPVQPRESTWAPSFILIVILATAIGLILLKRLCLMVL
ncbi:hypothetical protein CHS0354_036539 [Potamilus streckersoni]|uniref:UBC core domain-containing protein n=1 Tax=Potamilus streckersoni TaxID=2493646 RepID=A0AAE0TAD2_9BIVA|nr:hypothetical protein CHS0354_036539 [Potamilus streckersoni]